MNSVCFMLFFPWVLKANFGHFVFSAVFLADFLPQPSASSCSPQPQSPVLSPNLISWGISDVSHHTGFYSQMDQMVVSGSSILINFLGCSAVVPKQPLLYPVQEEKLLEVSPL